jgi:hypothetical protein
MIQGGNDYFSPVYFWTGTIVNLNTAVQSSSDYYSGSGAFTRFTPYIEITAVMQGVSSGGYYPAPSAWTAPGGATRNDQYGVASDMLAVIAAVTIDYPPVSVAAGVGSALLAYASQTSGSTFVFGTGGSGAPIPAGAYLVDNPSSAATFTTTRTI